MQCLDLQRPGYLEPRVDQPGRNEANYKGTQQTQDKHYRDGGPDYWGGLCVLSLSVSKCLGHNLSQCPAQAKIEQTKVTDHHPRESQDAEAVRTQSPNQQWNSNERCQ